MKITIYRLPGGSLSLTVRGAFGEEFEAELADGFRVGEGLGGASAKYVFGAPGTLGMTADAAVKAGVLVLPMTK